MELLVPANLGERGKKSLKRDCMTRSIPLGCYEHGRCQSFRINFAAMECFFHCRRVLWTTFSFEAFSLACLYNIYWGPQIKKRSLKYTEKVWVCSWEQITVTCWTGKMLCSTSGEAKPWHWQWTELEVPYWGVQPSPLPAPSWTLCLHQGQV